ncbi:hypothetical protein ACWEKR_02205 [Nocardia sp. NPDC004573]
MTSRTSDRQFEDSFVFPGAMGHPGYAGHAPTKVTGAVLDPDCPLVALQRQDPSDTLRPLLSATSASGELGPGFSSREIAGRGAAPLPFATWVTTVAEGIEAAGLSADTGEV